MISNYIAYSTGVMMAGVLKEKLPIFDVRIANNGAPSLFAVLRRYDIEPKEEILFDRIWSSEKDTMILPKSIARTYKKTFGDSNRGAFSVLGMSNLERNSAIEILQM